MEHDRRPAVEPLGSAPLTSSDLDLSAPIDDAAFDGPPPTVRQKVGGSTAAAIASAAMLGVGEVLEPEKTAAPVEIVSESPDDEPIIDLDFGSLPSLDA